MKQCKPTKTFASDHSIDVWGVGHFLSLSCVHVLSAGAVGHRLYMVSGEARMGMHTFEASFKTMR